MSQHQLVEAFSSLHKKIEKLVAVNQLQATKIDQLEKLNQKLTESQHADRKELEKAKRDIEFLSMSYRMASSADNLISARRNLSRLIRTIDNCIRMLNEDLI